MGRVKSRLARDTDTHQALHVHRRLLSKTVETAGACRVPVQFWVADAAGFYAESWLSQGQRRHRRRQRGADLGTRMHHALQSGLKTTQSVLLVGSDCPELSVDYLQAAFRALKHHRVVIGPATDGGYVLIGMRGVSALRGRAIFRQVSWGSERVLSQTLSRLQRAGIGCACLPPLSDVDRAEDLWRHASALGLNERQAELGCLDHPAQNRNFRVS